MLYMYNETIAANHWYLFVLIDLRPFTLTIISFCKRILRMLSGAGVMQGDDNYCWKVQPQ